MDNTTLGIILITVAVLSLTTAQVVIKTRLGHHGAVPLNLTEGFPYFLRVIADWQMWVGLMGLSVSSLLWYAAISRLPLSVAYPFAALSYPLVFVGSLLFLGEAFSWLALAGNGLILVGVLLVATAG